MSCSAFTPGKFLVMCSSLSIVSIGSYSTARRCAHSNAARRRAFALPAETLRIALVDHLHIDRNRFRHIGAPLLRERNAKRDAYLVSRELRGRFDELRIRLLNRG